ncbi:Extracellular metalloproteinase 5 OS=Trichophyton rubrum GN=MEP5 PE=1 SV=1 [Rhizoctonia solani AG-1 IB]|uniref:Extracellular metalloproteinase n=1 Tax=Thanatephorus cucumeris (strain AG1-IB / isolate 7/3/14) TaxID=1108050 RepID=A0A0B7FTL9_THACB|nr:Extracellular metalloproteinase 5 OS=Trichophyton rubrum GN=MEP5 PE=1 SV=1 [Rhizoctonia solani AG-1 IB]
MKLRCDTLVSIAFSVFAAAHSTRKSLNFGLRHPTARYVTEPQVTSTFMGSSDPYDVAKSFLSAYTASDYYIREDSYIDRNSGIAHIYARQKVDGLEVADGDINLNIRDGRVLSYGDSFYRGAVPASFDKGPSTSYASHCPDLPHEKMTVPGGNHQMVFAGPSRIADELHIYNYARPLAPAQEALTDNGRSDLHDSRYAALYFMIAAHTDQAIVDDLTQNFDRHINRMAVASEIHSIGNDSHTITVISGLPGSVSPVKARVVYVQSPTKGNETELNVVWRMEVQMKDNWYEAYISAFEPSTIISVIDWASDSPIPPPGGKLNALETKLTSGSVESEDKPGSYKVWKWGLNDPESGERSIEAWHDKIGSPLGWHTISKKNNPEGSPDWVGRYSKGGGDQTYLNFTTTWGNNVFAHANWEGGYDWISNYRPDAGADLKFEFKHGPKTGLEESPAKSPKHYIDLSITQLFYTSNMIHDLYYRYGFDEFSGNFQQDNYGRGGKEGDGVVANAQDGSAYNNANFITPPDGKNGRCYMYLWNAASPFRDSDLEAGIVIHELTHGLSGRLTGGPANAGCLAWGESSGMGEGWSDFFATIIRSTEEYKDFAIGGWVANKPNGIRHYLYSTNITVNPFTYKSLDEPRYLGVHAIGEVWAEILWVVSQRLVAKHGYSDTLFPPQPLEGGNILVGDFYRPRVMDKPLVPKHGNTLMIQLVISAMKLQPCRPSFFDARDAIIQADDLLTGGENFCELWAGFSSRGLGTDASYVGVTPWGGGVRNESFKLPAKCKPQE